MAATITYSSTRATITGAYKEFTGTSTFSVVTFSAGEAPASGDIGRHIFWLRGGAGSTAQWECRRIISASATTVTVHDNWSVEPTAGDTFRITLNADDILAAQPSAGSKTGTSSFAMNCDFALADGAVFGSADESIEWTRGSSSTMFPLANGTAIVCGQLWGGEGVGRQTTNGSRWSVITSSGTSLSSLYSGVNSRLEDGPVVNFFGCLIESGGTSQQLFQRMRGPTRFIGCVMDGVKGGRFYHEASEWVDCRMSGNSNVVPAWSIGATFTRDIDTIFFYRNLMAMKSYLEFGGTLRNVTFADNNDIFDRSGNSSSVFNFIDCTEFGVADTTGTGGIVNQLRSINLVTTESDGTALDGVVVRVNNKNDTTQGSVQTSAGGGIVDEILALRFQQLHGSSAMTAFAPYRTRMCKYGYRPVQLNAAIADPIKQSSAMTIEPNVTQDIAVAAAHTGITVTDHGGSPVPWQGKSWGITVQVDYTVNPSLTVDDLKHYLHWGRSLATPTWGKPDGPSWHDMLPMTGTETANDTYGAVTKGVRVIDQNGDPVAGITKMQANDGTFYIPPVTYNITVTNSEGAFEARIRDGSITIDHIQVTGSDSYSYNYEYSGIVLTYILQINKPGFITIRLPITLSNQSQSIELTMEPDPSYVP